MKNLDFYQKLYNQSTRGLIFEAFCDRLKQRFYTWDYFVNWNKVFKNVEEILIDLNTLNYLIGRSNFKERLKILLNKNPEIIRVLPFLVGRTGAIKDRSSIQKLKIWDLDDFKLTDFDFSNFTPCQFSGALDFFEKTGLKKIITENKIKSFVDYVLGIEVGLDSHGRKNRAGQMMENICASYLENLCRDIPSLSFDQGVKSSRILQVHSPQLNLSIKKFDFVLYVDNRPYCLIEVDIYNTSGSKIAAKINRYIKTQEEINRVRRGLVFIWITDGQGLRSVGKDLRQAFSEIDYILNIDALQNKALNLIVSPINQSIRIN